MRMSRSWTARSSPGGHPAAPIPVRPTRLGALVQVAGVRVVRCAVFTSRPPGPASAVGRRIADCRSKMEAVHVERWCPGRKAVDEVRSRAAVSRGDSHRRSMGGGWKDRVLPHPGRPPALSRERCADDGRSGTSVTRNRILPNRRARIPGTIRWASKNGARRLILRVRSQSSTERLSRSAG
jgi:hypothetical protein